MRRLVSGISLLLAAAAPVVAAAADIPEPETPVRADAAFTPVVAVAQGVVEGLTEYLPVSSTGHLIIANNLMGLEKETPVTGRDGKPVVVDVKPSFPKRIVAKLRGEKHPPYPTAPYTLKQATDDYSIVIQFGAILAVLFAFWSRISGTVAGVLRLEKKSLLLSRNLLVAFFPAALVGLALGKLIDAWLFCPGVVAGALAGGGVVMLWVEKRHRAAVKAAGGETGPDMQEMSVKQSAIIGFCQCAALVPGTSRSMATIVGGYLAGLSPARATEFSFLLGLVTLTAASFYKGIGHGPQLVKAFPPSTMLLGMAVAGVVAFASVKWMIGWITRHGIGAFAWYRFALSAGVLLWFYA